MRFRYNKILLNEVKVMDGARWHPESKQWHVPNTQRNRFQLEFLQNRDPYTRYDADLIKVESNRPLYVHQIEMVAHALTRHYCIFACEMGTGKTLAAIEVLEHIPDLNDQDVWYIGPKSGVRAVNLELLKWQAQVCPGQMLTYERMKKIMRNWISGIKAPRVVIFDESSKLKTPTSQQSELALALANGVRNDWGDQGYVIEMSGTPAPKTPLDWWQQCISGDTLIKTTSGLLMAKEIVGRHTFIEINGKVINTDGTFVTGTKQLHRVTTEEGYSIRATDGHMFLVDYDGLRFWKFLKDIGVGDTLVINDVVNNHWDGIGTEDDGYILGVLFGDGNVYRKGCGRLKFFEDDGDIFHEILRIIVDASITTGYHHKVITSKYLNGLIKEYGIDSKKVISLDMMKASSDFIKGFLRGVFDADGSVEQTRLRITLTQTDRHNIEKIQLMLQCIGIYSKIYKKPAPKGTINGSKPTNKLVITNQYAKKYFELVGFKHHIKYKKLYERVQNKHHWETVPLANIESITKDTIETVYDITVPKEHCFSANGIVVHNCEVACPGFIKEGNIHKFRNRLAIVEERENQITGGKYPYIVGWRDSVDRCEKCGKLKSDPDHDAKNLGDPDWHSFTPCINEVAKLYERMNGLVLVQFKKDCMDLPDKQYKIIQLRPSPDTLRTALLIKKTAGRAIEVLTLCRELSDGFQYTEIETGIDIECPRCLGTKTVTVKQPVGELDLYGPNVGTIEYEDVEIVCDNCSGLGLVAQYARSMDEVPTPKDDQLIEDLRDHEEVGRLIVWGGFTGTVDRIVTICHKEGWSVLRVDGRGYVGTDFQGNPIDDTELLIAMDNSHPRQSELLEKHKRLCFVGHPKAGGMALTLTASPTEIFYSNDFAGEARMQAEDRFHRGGMDTNRGATIIDYFHLPTDKYVHTNLMIKKNLQNISMGDLNDVFKEMGNV
jgi:hypothetical protein